MRAVHPGAHGRVMRLLQGCSGAFLGCGTTSSSCYRWHDTRKLASMVHAAKRGQVQQVGIPHVQQQQRSRRSCTEPVEHQAFLATIHLAVSLLAAARASYCLDGAAAAVLQGVQLLSAQLREVRACVQWDHLQPLHQRLQQLGHQPSGISGLPRGVQRFSLAVQPSGCSIVFFCQRNTVVAADPARVELLLSSKDPTSSAAPTGPGAAPAAEAKDAAVFGKSLYHMLRHQPQLAASITAHLAELQAKLSHVNSAAWQHEDSYAAWLLRHGPPSEAAAKLLQDPLARLQPLDAHLPAFAAGSKAINLLGSHGSKAVALALLGAETTVVDVSQGNARYAAELAQHAGVRLRYIVSDVLALPQEELDGSYQAVVMEMGVLHYFLHLAPLMRVVAALLAPGGRLVLRDFHPVSTKLITSRGSKHKVDGDYFGQGLAVTQVAFSKYSSGGAQPQAAGAGRRQQLKQPGRGAASASLVSSLSNRPVFGGSSSMSLAEFSRYDVAELVGSGLVLLKRWTLAEVVSAVAAAGLQLVVLEEEPNEFPDHKDLPKTFTIVALKH